MDVINDYAFPMPIIVIAELLGLPAEDRDIFKGWVEQSHNVQGEQNPSCSKRNDVLL